MGREPELLQAVGEKISLIFLLLCFPSLLADRGQRLGTSTGAKWSDRTSWMDDDSWKLSESHAAEAVAPAISIAVPPGR